jgi:hypothetical protein
MLQEHQPLRRLRLSDPQFLDLSPEFLVRTRHSVQQRPGQVEPLTIQWILQQQPDLLRQLLLLMEKKAVVFSAWA